MSLRLPFLFAAGLLASCGSPLAATTRHPFGRPLIPDMVPDANIVDIDGVFYCYATTDGWGRHLDTSGTPVVVLRPPPHVDQKPARGRYLRLTILNGEPGLWEFRVY